MLSYIGKADNKDLRQGNRQTKDGSAIPTTWKLAQSVMEQKSKSASSEQLINLSQIIFRTVLKSWATDGKFLHNTASSVMGWALTIPESSQGDTPMSDPEKWFIEKLFKNPRTIEVHSFLSSNLKHIWVIVEETNAEIEFEYSKNFADLVEKFQDFYCDFMVFSKEELISFTFPEDFEQMITYRGRN